MTQTAAPWIREISSRDDLGRWTCVQYKDFWAYIEHKKITKADLLKLKADRREDFFIKWKHGMDDINTNWEFEYSLKGFLRNFQDMPFDAIDSYFRETVKRRRSFEEYCEKIKAEIGLWSGKREVPPEIKALVDQVGGTVVNYTEQKPVV